MPPILRVELFMTLFLLVISYAVGRGERPERLAAAIMMGGLLLTWLLVGPVGRRFHGPEAGIAVADTCMLVAFLALMLTADRFWPIWVTAMQSVIVLCHLAMTLKPETLPTYYMNTVSLWSYPQLALLAVGTLRHRLRTEPSRTELALAALAHKVWRHSPNEQPSRTR